MKKLFLSLFLISSLLSLIISSCKVVPSYESPSLSVGGLYRDSAKADTNTIAALPYTDVFTDPFLQKLISEGITKNLDLKIAYTRVQQAQSYYAQSGAEFLPAIGATAQVTRSKLSKTQGFGIRNSSTQYQLGINSSWEIDLWGKLNSARRARLASLLQNQSAARAIQTSLVASIATYYYSLITLDSKLAITELTVQNWDTTVQTMQALKEAAVVTGAAVVQSEASRYAAEVTIPDLKQDIRETENALSILLGRVPGPIERSSVDSQRIAPLLQIGVPAQLLANRPDVQEAEYNLRSAFEEANVARTYFYPALTISGSAGISSLTLRDFFDVGSVFANIAAGLTQPIFNQRQNKTRLEVARSQQQAALLSFQNTLLTAGREVSDAISLYETARDKVAVRTNQLNALQKSVEYSRELLRYGSANYIEVINARQSLLGAELNRVNDRLQELQAVVNLYRALGGGWK